MLLRPAEPDDAMGAARVHVRSWQAAYRDLLSADYLERLRPEERAQRYNFSPADPRQPATIVAVDAGLIVGFATTAPAHESDAPESGELCALNVDPERWGCGIGAALVSAARARLLGLGFPEAILWAMVGNARADRFYRIDGWRPDGARRTASVWGVTVEELCYRRALVLSGPGAGS